MRTKVLLALLVPAAVVLAALASDRIVAGSTTRCGAELWNAIYNSERLAHSADRITAGTMDADGNVYVTGWSTGVESRYCDIVTRKYDRLGVEQWTHHFYPAGQQYSDSEGWGIAVDPSGNVYVAGHATGAYGVDYCLVKYPPSYRQGDEPEWVRTYDGPGHGHDQAWDAAVDAAGNVYLTGVSVGAGTSSDYATLKYDGAGTLLWAARYDGTGHQADSSFALAVDAAGSVYVTGGSANASGNSDIVTVKYDAAGVPQWVDRYDGPGGEKDRGQSLVLDGAGGVYVTGWSMGAGTNLDYATIAYRAADGSRKWTTLPDGVARYDGPASGNDQPAPPTGPTQGISFGSYLSANQGLVVVREADGRDYVYVTGQSTGVNSAGAAASLDFATVKYGADDGLPAWSLPGQPGTTAAKPGNPADTAARYNGPGDGIDRAWAVVADQDGYVYVAGPSTGIGTNVDYAIVKYDRNGAPLWDFGARSTGGMTREVAARYNGPGNGADTAAGFATVQDPAAGTERLFRDDASGVDHVCVTGGSRGAGDAAMDYYAMMLRGSDGAALWDPSLGRYDWSGIVSGFDSGSDVAFDGASGRVYVTGATGTWGAYDFLTAAYSPSGTLLWAQRFNGAANLADTGHAVQLDAAGIVYVAGTCTSLHGGAADADFCTLKYDGATGAPLWGSGSAAVRLYNGPGTNAADTVADLAVDDDGNVYVAGSGDRGLGTLSDLVTVSYAPDGSHRWTARYDGPAGQADAAAALAVDGSLVYVTGSSYGTQGDDDYVTLAYDRVTGAQVWARTYDGTGHGTDTAADVAVGPAGSVVVTGASRGTTGNPDYVTLAYDSVSGSELWTQRYDGPANDGDGAVAVAVDAAGSVYVAGASIGDQSGPDVVTVKYDSGGGLRWVNRYDGAGGWADGAYDLAVTPSGRVFVAGYATGSGGARDYLVLELDGATGARLMTATFDGDAGAQDEARALALGPAGTVVVTGLASGRSSADDAVTIAYAPGAAPVADAGPDQTLADNRCPLESEAVALDGSGSADPDGEIVLYRWSEEGTVLVSGVEPFATVTLPVGSHTLRLDVTDDCNRTASDSVVVTIGGPAPSEMISALVDAVIGYRLDPGIEASLLPKLDGALAALTAEPPSKAAAIGKLRAFVTECEALRGRRLPPEAADRLAREARCVILALRS